ncbi:hypothetical protein M407DRAFT_243194 [Tulasnella calospora MUT 4182]|uniref:Uncharacterized protein n=1 Tax=Tulasnella calospora MUT 4182 TaxID=1051891 RepID=A0A0C3QKJ8_9AGAM|nr:hypothetical protein M407DRAFT_243194 [Tulasnella calospora MUT 4182]
MPISPEDLEGYPDLEEKSAALVQWAQRKGQAVRLLGAMQKAYLSVMVASEPEVDNDPRHAERAHSTQHDDDQERPLKSNHPHLSQGFPSNDMSSTSSSMDLPIETSKQPGPNNVFKRDRAGRFARSGTSKKIGREKAKAKAKAFVVSSSPSRDDGFWAAFGY